MAGRNWIAGRARPRIDVRAATEQQRAIDAAIVWYVWYVCGVCGSRREEDERTRGKRSEEKRDVVVEKSVERGWKRSPKREGQQIERTIEAAGVEW